MSDEVKTNISLEQRPVIVRVARTSIFSTPFLILLFMYGCGSECKHAGSLAECTGIVSKEIVNDFNKGYGK